MDGGRGLLLAANDTERDFTDVEVVVERKLLCGSLEVEGHEDGPPGVARLLEPRGIAVDPRRQRVYITELNSIRAVDLRTGCISTVAGGVDEGDPTDGPASTVRFNNLRGASLSLDGERLAVCDFWNHCVREVTFGDDPYTLQQQAPRQQQQRQQRQRQAFVRRRVGGGLSFSRPGELSTPNDVAFGRTGKLYIACGSGFDDDTIRAMSPDGAMSLEAGVLGSAGDADGPCRAATFDSPQGIAVDDSSAARMGSGLSATGQGAQGSGGAAAAVVSVDSGDDGDASSCSSDVYVADYCNHTIRKISGGRVITIGGKAAEPGDTDGDGSESRFTEPTAICLSSAPLAGSGERTIYVAEGCGRLRWLRRVWCCSAENESASNYLVGTIQGTPELWAPRGLATVPGGSGDLLVTDTGKSVVWQLCLRSALQHREALARKRLAVSLLLHRTAGAHSAGRMLSSDLVESVCLLPLLSPPLAAVMATMPRPLPVTPETPALPSAAVALPPPAVRRPEPQPEPELEVLPAVEEELELELEEQRQLVEEVTAAEAAKQELVERIRDAERLLANQSRVQPPPLQQQGQSEEAEANAPETTMEF
jgi:hypothetical protein